MILATLFASVLAVSNDPPTPPPAKPKQVCRTLDMTGTILSGRRMCKTKAEWERFDSGNHEAAAGMNDKVKQGSATRIGD